MDSSSEDELSALDLQIIDKIVELIELYTMMALLYLRRRLNRDVVELDRIIAGQQEVIRRQTQIIENQEAVRDAYNNELQAAGLIQARNEQNIPHRTQPIEITRGLLQQANTSTNVNRAPTPSGRFSVLFSTPANGLIELRASEKPEDFDLAWPEKKHQGIETGTDVD